MLAEWRWPLERRWSMTKRSFGRRDLPFLISGIVVSRICEAIVAVIATKTVANSGFGPLARLPLGLQVIVAIALFDLGWYTYHRSAHSTRRLWRVHGAHHWPSQMYILMHGIFHPLDELVVRLVLPLIVFRFMGYTPTATLIALTLIGSVAIVSHTNSDIRIWVLNHVFIGPETHRVHHSATHRGNYGTCTTIWDQLFGTFVFSSSAPERLGLENADQYPNPEHFLEVVAWPFRHTDSATTTVGTSH